jgi:tetratricopeptide (TPR) repeat protein
MALDDRRHPDAEQLAEYADGLLRGEAATDIERHLVECAECRAVVANTMDLLLAGTGAHVAETTSSVRVVPFRSRRWVTGVVAGLAAAAAIALVVRVERPAWLFGPRTDRPELQELIAALANEPTRPVEGRLSGGFRYAPPPSFSRSPGDRQASPDVRIAAGEIEKRANDGDALRHLASLGAAYLALDDIEDAIRVLQAAATESPTSAPLSSDLSVAYLARWERTRRSEDLEKSLRAAEQALASDPTMAEAEFNRALALEQLGRTESATAAWRTYLATDARSPWAEEARRRLDALSERSPR